MNDFFARRFLVKLPGELLFVEVIEVPEDIKKQTGIKYCTSAESTAAVIGKKSQSVERFVTSDKNPMLRDDLNANGIFPKKLSVEGNVVPVTPISFKTALLYWASFGLKSDENAQKVLASFFDSAFFSSAIKAIVDDNSPTTVVNGNGNGSSQDIEERVSLEVA